MCPCGGDAKVGAVQGRRESLCQQSLKISLQSGGTEGTGREQPTGDVHGWIQGLRNVAASCDNLVFRYL